MGIFPGMHWWTVAAHIVLQLGCLTAAKKPVKTRILALFIGPIVLTALVYPGLALLHVFLPAMLVGALTGYLSNRRVEVPIEETTGLVTVPRNWSSYIIVFVLFLAQLNFGHWIKVAADPTRLLVAQAALNGALSGLFVGGLINILVRYRRFFSKPASD